METHIITWRGIEIEITFTPEKFGMTDYIELHAIWHRGGARLRGCVCHRVA